jgi:hypothetical protein
LSFRALGPFTLLTLLLSFPTGFDVSLAAQGRSTPERASIPRTNDGKPNLQGIWKASRGAAADLSKMITGGGSIPYQPWAAKKRAENFAARATADPLSKCYMPGVPRIMSLDYPFHIFQTGDAVAITFEWQQVFRLIHTNGSKPPDGIEFWMGDSRGTWEGDTLVVNVTNHNDKTWFDAAGNFHSEALKLVERYTLTDADSIRYDVTFTDPKVLTKPWTISLPLSRQKNMTRILEYQCQAEAEEAKGLFERDPLTWYPKK